MSAAAAKKKKGLSIEEKTVLVERWITAHPQPYTMKELLQLIPKQTPVIYQSIEECVQLLVAENRVQQDRIGVSTLFWKFPLTDTQKRNPAAGLQQNNGSASSGGRLTYAELLRRLRCNDVSWSADAVSRLCAAVDSQELRDWCMRLQAEHETLDRLLSEECTRVGFTEEAPLQQALDGLQRCVAQRTRLLAQHKALSSLQSLPELCRRLADATAVATEAANRWTDNYYLAEMEVVAKTGQSQRDVRAALQLPLDVDLVSSSDDDDDAEDGNPATEKARKNGNVAQNGAAIADKMDVAGSHAVESTLVEASRVTITAKEEVDAGAVDMQTTDEEKGPAGVVEAPSEKRGSTKPQKPAPKKRNARKRAR